MADDLQAIRDRLKAMEDGVPPTVQKGADVHVTRGVEVTVGELLTAIHAHPEHPVAQAWRNNVSLPDNTILTVDKNDLVALMENKVVEVERKVETHEGVPSTMIRKSVGGSYTPPTESVVLPVKHPQQDYEKPMESFDKVTERTQPSKEQVKTKPAAKPQS